MVMDPESPLRPTCAVNFGDRVTLRRYSLAFVEIHGIILSVQGARALWEWQAESVLLRRAVDALFIWTSAANGLVHICCESLDSAADVEYGWPEMAEVSLYLSSNGLTVTAIAEDPVGEHADLNPQGPGWYRIRVYANARDYMEDFIAFAPTETFLVQAWPVSGPEPPVYVSAADLSSS